MNFRLVQFEKKSESVLSLQDTVRDVVIANGALVSVSMHESSYSGKVVIQLLLDESVNDYIRGERQEIRFFGIEPVNLVEDMMNSYLSGLGKRSVKAINLLLFSSNRALGLVVAESAAEADNGNTTPGKETKRKSNKNSNAGADG